MENIMDKESILRGAVQDYVPELEEAEEELGNL